MISKLFLPGLPVRMVCSAGGAASVWTQNVPPHDGQLHFVRSRSRNAVIPSLRMNARFSIGDSLSG